MGFTPGPWEAEGAKVCRKGRALANVSGGARVAKANARLMAAAPELYELIVAVRDSCSTRDEQGAWIDRAEALLARIDCYEMPWG